MIRAILNCLCHKLSRCEPPLCLACSILQEEPSGLFVLGVAGCCSPLQKKTARSPACVSTVYCLYRCGSPARCGTLTVGGLPAAQQTTMYCTHWEAVRWPAASRQAASLRFLSCGLVKLPVDARVSFPPVANNAAVTLSRSTGLSMPCCLALVVDSRNVACSSTGCGCSFGTPLMFLCPKAAEVTVTPSSLLR
jgi:hypothetical protein